MNDRVTSKSIIARDFVFKSKCMLGGRAPPEPAVELERSPRHPGRSGCHGREHSSRSKGALCGEEGVVESTLEEAEMNDKGYF